MTNQDFTKRIAIVVSKDLPSWKAMNTVSHISAYFGNKMDESFDTGEYFSTKDKIDIPRNSQYPIIIFAAKQTQLTTLADKVRELSDIKSMFFVKEMIDTGDDSELEKLIGDQEALDLTYYGIGMFGDNETIKKITNKYKLWS
jgi:hypothetical protein